MHRMNPAKPYQATPKNAGIYRGKQAPHQKMKITRVERVFVKKTKVKNTARPVPELKDEKQGRKEAVTSVVQATATKKHQQKRSYSRVAVLMSVMLMTVGFVSLVQAESPQSSSIVIAKTLRHICTTKPFSSPNKPDDFIFARYQLPSGRVVSTSAACREMLLYNGGFSEACQDDTNSLKLNRNSAGRIKMREIRVKTDEWVESEQKKMQAVVLNEMSLGLPFELAQRFAVIVDRIVIMKQAKAHQAHAKKNKMGNCGEHAAHASMEILNLSQRYQVPIKLQQVDADADDFNHSFLLIDSDLPDVVLKNDAKAVSAYLQSVKQGYVCDTWQEGYYMPATSKNEDNLIYRGGYHSVKVETQSLEFDLNGFPDHIVKYIKDEIKQLGFGLLSGGTPFHFFKPAVKRPAEAPVVDVPKVKLDL